MDFTELKELAFKSRSMREIGVGLVCSSTVLAAFLVWPLSYGPTAEPEVVFDTVEQAPLPAPDAFARVHVQATAAIVYDLATGEMLYGKNPDAQLPLASLTKLLAVYAALDSLESDSLVTVSQSATAVDAPRAFSPGQVLSLGDISRLTLTASLNDGAAAIVETVAEHRKVSENAVLSDTVDKLKLTQTYALNGSGLDMTDTVSGAYGSVRDMARLAGALVDKAPDIARATTKDFATASSQNGTGYSVRNTDPIVNTLPHLLLSKTGFTDLAGGNLALVIDVGINHPVAIVVMGSSRDARFTDSVALVAATLAHFAGVESI